MKRRFATKLMLSGAALAVSAATLVSTTYAWYVQNSQVTATGITGSVKDSEASSIYIAKAATISAGSISAEWGPSVVLDNTNYVNGGLYPVTLTGATSALAGTFKDVNNTDLTTYAETSSFVYGGTYYKFDDPNYTKEFTIEIGTTYYKDSAHTQTASSFLPGNTYYFDDGTQAFTIDAAPVKYYTLPTMTFSLYVMSTTNTKVRPYVIVENKSTVNNQTAYRTIKYDTTNKINQGDEFWVDAVQALRMQIAVQESDTTNNKWGDASFKNYDLLNVAKKDDTYVKYDLKTGSKDESKFEDETFYKKATGAYDSGTTYYADAQGAALGSQPTEEQYNNGTYYVEDATLQGANAYYRGLVGSAPDAGFVEENHLTNPIDANKIDKYDLTAAKAYKFTFTIWLEGTDISCFDCCSKQLFDFTINFDVEE